MKAILLGLWNDPAQFRAALRSSLVIVATLANTGVIPVGTYGWWVAQFATAVAVGIPAGQQNAPAAGGA